MTEVSWYHCSIYYDNLREFINLDIFITLLKFFKILGALALFTLISMSSWQSIQIQENIARACQLLHVMVCGLYDLQIAMVDFVHHFLSQFGFSSNFLNNK